jgi:MYXO-CTERM domain-containing protein
MNKQLKSGAALLFAAGAFTFVGTAQAAPVGAVCTGNGTSTGSFLLSNAAGMSCTIGDKTYSNFSYTGFASSDLAQNVVNMSESGAGALQHTIGMQNTAGWTSASNTFSYTISIASGSNLLDKWAATGSSSIIDSGFTSTVTATNSSPSPNPNGAVNAFSTVGSPSIFNAATTSSAFVNTFTVTNNAFTSFDNSVIQKDPTTTTATPGPLPLLGAGAAFSLSRRIRNRIKLAA